MQQKTKLKIILVIAILAFFNAFYLSSDWIFWVDQVAQTSTSFYPIWNQASGWKFCDINETLSCTTVLQHDAAQLFWVPFPVIALFVYPIIFIIALLGFLWRMRKHFWWLATLWIGGMMFNGYFIYQETFTIKAFCPLCLICSAIIITIFTLSFLEVRKECKAKKLEEKTQESVEEPEKENGESNTENKQD